MNYIEIQILLVVLVGASASFLSTPSNQFQSTFNSSFLGKNDRLLNPIVIPNLTEFSRTPKPKNYSSELYSRKRIHLERIPESENTRENALEEEVKPSENSLKFSSRYSSKADIDEEITKDVKGLTEKENESVESIKNVTGTTEAPSEIQTKETSNTPENDKYKFTERSDDGYFYSEEDDEEGRISHRYSDSNEAGDSEEVEESDVASTTSEPYREIQRPYDEEEFGNYETSSPIAEENEDPEEEAGGRRSVEDYHDSSSKNYHSVQTPLNKIQFRGPHAFKDDFDSGKTRTRLISPIRRRPINYHWPYSKAQLKAEQKFNEISDEDEWRVEEPKTGLELAAEKDEAKFDQTKTYNHIDERNRRKQKEKSLAKEEEKDHESPFFQSLKNHRGDEEESILQANTKFGEKPRPKQKSHEGVWSTILPKTEKGRTRIPLKSKSYQGTNIVPTKFSISKELTPDFQGHQFLGPVVFNPNAHQKVKPTVGTNFKYTPTVRNIFLKDLDEREKLDENLSKQRIQKAIPQIGKLQTQSFNHLEESDEMYNQILANIQSVFGIRTQPLKSAAGRKSGAGSLPELHLEENRSFTWSLPLLKREKVSLEASALRETPDKVKSGSEGPAASRKSHL